MAAAANLPADPDFDSQHLMLKPGFKVMHVQDVDYRSNCQPFLACLAEVRAWSHAHPGHIPVFLLIETKQSSPKDLKAHRGGALHLCNLRCTRRRDPLHLPPRRTHHPRRRPRCRFDTLNQAVLAGHWPTLAAARGKVVFLMDQRSVGPVYLAGHPSLRGRVLFTNAEPGEPDAAFIERNEGPAANISTLVRQGYLIRARTDSDTRQARLNDTSTRVAMLASGAQLLSTDYPAYEPARWPGHYFVAFPGKAIARCNPINASASCSSLKDSR